MKPLTILNVNTHEERGGAAKVACQLHRAFLERGHDSWYAVSQKSSDDERVLTMSDNETAWKKACRRISAEVHARSPKLASRIHHRLVADVGQPLRWLNASLGKEDMLFPDTRKLLDRLPQKPDVILCHNLHGGYFDLREIVTLSQAAPLAFSMHDAWLLAGHCAHSLGCDRWRNGCGKCPDISRSVALRRDGSHRNWNLKKTLYSRSEYAVITPCEWLMGKVERSILNAGMLMGEVIPYGLDLGATFRAGNKLEERARLGLPDNAFICLFAASGIKSNIWKDYKTIREALSILADRRPDKEIICLGLGDDGPPQRRGNAMFLFQPYLSSPEEVARHYRASDVYVHAAHADTFPNVILEAHACGLPVVATAVCGIPEQLKEGVTGFLTPPRDAHAMAAAIERLLDDPERVHIMGAAAERETKKRRSLERMVDEYLDCLHRLALRRGDGRRR